MSLTLISAPAVEPLFLAEVKNHLRVEEDQLEDDALIVALMETARTYFEGRHGILNQALITQTWEWTLDCFPRYATMPMRVPLPPLQSVSSITYVDTAGDTSTWSASNYRVDTASQPGRITPAYGEIYPSARNVTNAITVRFVAGYGSSWNDVPKPLRQAMLMLVAHLYEHREPVVVGSTPAELPHGLNALVAPYRRAWF